MTNNYDTKSSGLITPAYMENAVAQGIISGDQASALLRLAASEIEQSASLQIAQQDEQDKDVTSSDEVFRLVGGNNDLFVTIGTILLIAGVYFALNTLLSGQEILISAIMAMVTWVTAEFITRQKRVKLASTVLGALFLCLIAQLAFDWLQQQFQISMPANVFAALGMRNDIRDFVLALTAIMVVATIIYFWRFRVPIMAASLALCFTALVFTMAALYLYDGVVSTQVQVNNFNDLLELTRNALYLPLICGLVIIGAGVALDLHDRERITTWSDCAFWLHLIAAPLIVHPLFILATGQDVVVGRIEPDATALTLLFVLIAVFVYCALAIDRRTLLIPTMGYFGSIGIYTLVSSTAQNTGIPSFALILLVVGFLIILFGSSWQHIRKYVVATTLPSFILAKLPPVKL